MIKTCCNIDIGLEGEILYKLKYKTKNLQKSFQSDLESLPHQMHN